MDVIESSLDGEWGKGESFDDSVEMYCIRGTDFESVRTGSLSGVPRRHIKRRHAERKVLQPHDVLIEVAGGTKSRPTGRTLLITGSLLAASDLPLTCASFSRYIRFDSELVDPEFMFWYLQALDARGELRAFNVQHTGVARFQWTTFSTTYLHNLPKPAEQRRWAGILGEFDALIANNRRRIEILEEMARLLYREWFVHFRFPGHEDVEMVDSELGPIPEGWETRTLGDVVVLSYGKALKKDDRRGGDVEVYGSGGVVGHHDERLRSGPGVIVGRKGNVGALYWSDADFYPIDTTYFVETELPLHFAYQLLGTLTFIDSHAAVPGLSRDQAYGLGVVLPCRSAVDEYEVKVAPIIGSRRNLIRQNRVLREARDLLLPRLVSGELDVSELDPDGILG